MACQTVIWGALAFPQRPCVRANAPAGGVCGEEDTERVVPRARGKVLETSGGTEWETVVDDRYGREYYHNAAKGSSWHRPKGVKGDGESKTEGGGELFETEHGSTWRRSVDAATDHEYFFNSTKGSAWTLPEGSQQIVEGLVSPRDSPGGK